MRPFCSFNWFVDCVTAHTEYIILGYITRHYSYSRLRLQVALIGFGACIAQIASFGVGDLFGTNRVREASVICQQHGSCLLVMSLVEYELLLRSKPSNWLETVSNVFKKRCVIIRCKVLLHTRLALFVCLFVSQLHA